MSDNSLLSLSGMSRLTHLEINGSSKVNDSGVKALVANCKRLSFLNLNFCEYLTLDCIAFAIETVKPDDTYPELTICFNNMRINTKKQDIEEIERWMKERDYDYFCRDSDLSETESESEESPEVGPEVEPT